MKREASRESRMELYGNAYIKLEGPVSNLKSACVVFEDFVEHTIVVATGEPDPTSLKMILLTDEQWDAFWYVCYHLTKLARGVYRTWDELGEESKPCA